LPALSNIFSNIRNDFSIFFINQLFWFGGFAASFTSLYKYSISFIFIAPIEPISCGQWAVAALPTDKGESGNDAYG
jgi:hypothetical protein